MDYCAVRVLFICISVVFSLILKWVFQMFCFCSLICVLFPQLLHFSQAKIGNSANTWIRALSESLISGHVYCSPLYSVFLLFPSPGVFLSAKKRVKLYGIWSGSCHPWFFRRFLSSEGFQLVSFCFCFFRWETTTEHICKSDHWIFVVCVIFRSTDNAINIMLHLSVNWDFCHFSFLHA